MVRGTLIQALDFRRRDGVSFQRYSIWRDDEWHVVEAGPRFQNVYRVTGYDAAGEKWLVAHERKE